MLVCCPCAPSSPPPRVLPPAPFQLPCMPIAVRQIVSHDACCKFVVCAGGTGAEQLPVQFARHPHASATLGHRGGSPAGRDRARAGESEAHGWIGRTQPQPARWPHSVDYLPTRCPHRWPHSVDYLPTRCPHHLGLWVNGLSPQHDGPEHTSVCARYNYLRGLPDGAAAIPFETLVDW